MQKLYVLIVAILLNICSVSSFSQVTIGSDVDPAKGALLDLKEFEPKENNTTATKGLMLPRVRLQALTGDLNKTLGLAETVSNEVHSGLVVFNVADADCPQFPTGVYVWNGNLWNGLGVDAPEDKFAETMDPDTNTGTLTDYEGNVYTTKRFKVLATDGSVSYNRVWTTQNLRSQRDAQGQWLNCPEGLYFNPAYNKTTTTYILKQEILQGTVGTYTNAGVVIENQSYDDFLSEFGILYSNNVAQKACPKGWSLPTRAEWKSLFVALGGIESVAGNGTDQFSGVGHASKKNGGKGYMATDLTSTTIWGNASVASNGFNAVPAGYIDLLSKASNSFGKYTSLAGVEYLIVINTTDVVSTSHVNYQAYSAVRCIKNEEN